MFCLTWISYKDVGETELRGRTKCQCSFYCSSQFRSNPISKSSLPITPNVVTRHSFIGSLSEALQLPSPLGEHGSRAPMLMSMSMDYVPYSLISALRARKSPHYTLGCWSHQFNKADRWEGCAALLDEETC